jgi:hypothetical protein
VQSLLADLQSGLIEKWKVCSVMLCEQSACNPREC